jgi:hypothetical protein
MNHIKKCTHNCEQFDEFHSLNTIEKFILLNGISINLFAIACCHIKSSEYLNELLDFMTREQFIEFVNVVNKIREVLPGLIFVQDSQGVIMEIWKNHKIHFSMIMDMSEIAEINFADGLRSSPPKVILSKFDSSKTIH